MLALHRNLAAVACGQADARESADPFSISHDDRLSGEPAERERHPFAPDALTNMPVHHAAAKLLAHGSKVAPFADETPPMREDPELISHHLASQRAAAATTRRRGVCPTDSNPTLARRLHPISGRRVGPRGRTGFFQRGRNPKRRGPL